jgi:uncharacterized membrane protein YkvA (DUF1232 family)
MAVARVSALCRCLAAAAFARHITAGVRYAPGGKKKMSFHDSASWRDVQALVKVAAADESAVRRGFWRKIRYVAGSLPFAEELLAAYYCAFDSRTPLQVKAVLLGAVAYFVMPVDLIPDCIPGIGYTDDAAVLAAAVELVASHINADHHEAARRVLAALRGEPEVTA